MLARLAAERPTVRRRKVRRLMTVAQKRFLEVLASLAVAGGFFVCFLAAAQLDAHPQPGWLVVCYLAGLLLSVAVAGWRLVLFFKS